MNCQFEFKCIEDGEEVTYSCPDEAEGIIRCKDVCRRHFRKVKQDNVCRNNRKIDIPEDFSLIIRDKWIKNRLVKNELS